MKRFALVVCVAISASLGFASNSHAAARLTFSQANQYAGTALHRHFKNEFDNGYALRGSCGRRLGPSSRFCPHISWLIGDFSFSGWVKIWIAHGWWNYSLKITRTDEYCLDVQHLPLAQCSDTTYIK